MRGGFINSKGFTLVETIIFIVVFSIGVMGFMVLFYNTLGKTSDPLLRIKAIQTAQAIMEIISSKKFDELTPNGGGAIDYNNASIGANELVITRYDDVDDFVNLCGEEKEYSSSDFGLTGNYRVFVKVTYAYISGNDIVEDCNNKHNYKMIIIRVTNEQLKEDYKLKRLKGNF